MSSAPTISPAAPMGQAAEHLQVKLRPDLIVQPQFYEGMTHYVVKDPIALKYFRFKVEEYFLLQQFDGKNTLQDVSCPSERKYGRKRSPSKTTRLHAYPRGRDRADRQPRPGQGLDPQETQEQVEEGLAILCQHPLHQDPRRRPGKAPGGMYLISAGFIPSYFITFSVGMMLAALTLVISQWTEFSSKLPEFQSFFNWNTIFAFWCSLAIVKVIHEFGHGLTAKHFGGEVHEMGMLFLVLTPALYCDVTDSWLLPNKWKRIWISAAGIYVECFLASIATFVWWNTEQGLLNSLMMATMFICSVNTIMFNANPLLRYDGYYVMADWP